MKGFRFLFLTGLVLVAVFTVGSLIGLTAGVVPNVTGILWYVMRVVVKFTLASVVFAILAWFVAIQLGMTFSKLLGSMHDRAEYPQENLGPVVILGGLLLAMGQIFSFAHASTFQVYVYEVFTKGSLGLALGIVATALIAWIVGVKSFARFTDLFADPKNNQLVIFLMIAFNTGVLIAMLS